MSPRVLRGAFRGVFCRSLLAFYIPFGLSFAVQRHYGYVVARSFV